MWQEITVGALFIAALFYIARRMYRSFVKGDHGACADCPPGEIKNPVRK